MSNVIDLSNYRLTIMDKIVAEGTLACLESMGEEEREEKVKGALRHGFDALFLEAKLWNVKGLEGTDGKDEFRSLMDGEYKTVWEELEPESFSRDLIPEFYRVFEDYLSDLKDAKNNRKDCKDAKETE